MREILTEVLIATPPLLYVVSKGLGTESLGLDSRSAMTEFAVALIVLPLALPLGLISGWLVQTIYPMSPWWQAYFTTSVPTSFEDFIVLLLIRSLAVAPCEEILFRGFVQNGLESGIGGTQGWILSSVLFGMIHFNPWQGVPAFLVGLLLGYLFRRRDHKLWCPIALHAFYDCGLTILSYAFHF